MAPEVIARDAELAVVDAFLNRAAPGLRVLVLEGEAGIGKSTLWLAGVAHARDRYAHVLTSRPAEAEQSLAHVVLCDLFEGLTTDQLATLPAPRRRAFESVLLLGPGEPQPIEPRTLAAAVLMMLTSLASEGPVLLAIDDEQWVDPASVASLAFAIRRLGRLPIRVLLSRRDGGLAVGAIGDDRLERAIDPEAVERLRVGPLSLGATSLLVRDRLGARLSRPDLLRVHEASGGNPFFALELARAARNASTPTGPLVVPAELERLLTTRLEGVDGEQRAALLLVAAHGRIPVELLARLGIASSTLRRAEAAGLIEVAGGAARFSHPLLASTLYQRATAEARRLAHLRLAAAVLDPVHRARHLALGTDTPDEAVALTVEAAAVAARDRGAPITAADLAEHAVRLTPPGRLDDELRRSSLAARAHLEAGSAGRARELVEAIVARAPGGADRANALILAAEQEPAGRAVDLLRQAIREADAEPSLEASIRARLAEVGRMTMGVVAAEREARTALRLADQLGEDRVRVRAQVVLAMLRFHAGQRDALELAREAHRHATNLADPELTRVAISTVSHVLAWMRRHNEARAWLEGALRDGADRDEVLLAECHWYLALVELWAGRWDVAEEHSRLAMDAPYYGRTVPQDYFPAALIAVHRGQLALARDLAARATDLSVGMILPGFPAILAFADLWAGQPAAAIERFAEVEAYHAARGWRRPEMLIGRPEHVEALLQVGRLEDAARLVSGWARDARRADSAWALTEVVRLEGLLAAARGDLETAVRRLDEAARRHEASGDAFDQGRALLALGTTQRRLRQKLLARSALEAARRTFEVLGAATFADVTRDELARLGGRRRIEGLSASERRVAELVVEGRTNREIALTLFLGERTVASHLTHAYAKLGVRSRTELARRLGAAGRPPAEAPTAR